MTKNELNYGELIVLIEDAIANGINISVICNNKLAEWLVEYIGIEYTEFLDNCQFDKNVDEYYVTFQTFEGELIITCEFARGKHGLLKEHDVEPCVHFVFTDNWREVYHAINSSMIALCELVEDEDEDDVEFECDDGDDCECICGDYDDCDDCEEYCNCDDCLVEEYTHLIVDASPCTHCVRTLLENFAEEIRDNNN